MASVTNSSTPSLDSLSWSFISVVIIVVICKVLSLETILKSAFLNSVVFSYRRPKEAMPSSTNRFMPFSLTHVSIISIRISTFNTLVDMSSFPASGDESWRMVDKSRNHTLSSFLSISVFNPSGRELIMLDLPSSIVMNKPFSPLSSALFSRNWDASMVLPAPPLPLSRTMEFSTRPPLVTSSSPSMPVPIFILFYPLMAPR